VIGSEYEVFVTRMAPLNPLFQEFEATTSTVTPQVVVAAALPSAPAAPSVWPPQAASAASGMRSERNLRENDIMSSLRTGEQQ
jgi:hypothetical protein